MDQPFKLEGFVTPSHPELETKTSGFVFTMCRDSRVDNCLQVGTDPSKPGVIALHESEEPGTVVTTSTKNFADFCERVKNDEFAHLLTT